MLISTSVEKTKLFYKKLGLKWIINGHESYYYNNNNFLIILNQTSESLSSRIFYFYRDKNFIKFDPNKFEELENQALYTIYNQLASKKQNETEVIKNIIPILRCDDIKKQCPYIRVWELG